MTVKLPEVGRPRDVRYRKCELGIDLPSQFVHDLQSLDSNLYPIFHPYRILWDDFVNEYLGPLEDPRYPIAENSHRAGELVMGHVLSNGQGVPTPDGNWHIWRFSEPARAWSHVIAVESKDQVYQRLLVRRLWLQSMFNDRFGHRGYQRMMEQADLDERAKMQADKIDLMNDISKANQSMMSRVRDNFEHGRTEPTRPMKETIMSGAGLTNKSRMVRPLSDEEGGIDLPENMRE